MKNNKINQIYNNEQSVKENLYQSTFLPIFSHAEIQIKKVIAKFFWELKPKYILVLAISKYIDEVIKRVPQNVINRQAYIDGLRVKANRMIDKYYTQARIVFGGILGLLIANQVKIGEKAPNINTPKELITYMKQTKIKYDMWSQAKAAVRVQNYPKQLNEYIEKLSHETITTVEPGKKGITLWQKAELDIRYEKQMSMIEELKSNGEDLCWISSHPDCSKRCEKWQGKLVSLTQHSKLSGFRVMKVDGIWVYSLTDIMAQKDKYGYNNNIICGFNCRHYLKPYTPGSVAPKQYDSEDIAKMRAVNTDLRALERRIRFYKEQEYLYNVKSDKINAVKSRNKARVLTKVYVDTCQKYGFAVQQYRINI